MGLLEPSDWTARWIGNREDAYPDSTLTTPAPYFRKTFRINKPVKQAKAYICGLGFYEMYLNGERVGDQVLAPAVTNFDRRPLKKMLYFFDDQSNQRVLYNTFDVTSLVQKAENTVGVLLGNGWYNQRDRTVEGCMWYDTPRLLCQLEIEYTDGSTELVVTDDSWKTTTGPLLHDAIFTGEEYDARLELDGWMGLGVALFILWSGVGILKETVDPLLGEAPSEELTDYIGKKVMSYDGVLGTHDLMVHDYGPGRRFASVHVEMAAENDVMQSHDIIDNIERDFQENDHISLIIHYDPILTGDDAVGTAREWVKELVRSISPELSIHDFRMVQGPSHTNLIFDTVVPHNFPLSDAALRKRIQSLVETHDAGETKYYAVVTIDHSYAAIPGACKTDGKE